MSLAITLASVPQGEPTLADFGQIDEIIAEPGPGELRVRVLYLSLDPYMRGVMSGRHMGHSVTLGSVLPGAVVGVVEVSHDARFSAGDFVQCEGGWREIIIVRAEQAVKIDPTLAPISTYLGVLGMPGLTAYAGLCYLADPRPGQTVVVSAAVGPVGSTVGQIAKILGCRAVGIAGGAAKCNHLITQFGFDEAVDYKRDDFAQRLAAACPNSIDVYFDNVGGAVLEACIGRLALHAKIILCGLIDQYNKDQRPPGPNLGPVIGARATMKGLVVYDHFDKLDEYRRTASGWIKAGKLRYLEDVTVGLANAPAAFCKLMRGENFGKSLVQLQVP
jgi:NADPH-dependent curcumin reductase CurA